MPSIRSCGLAGLLLLAPGLVYANSGTTDAQNMAWIAICAALVFFMQAGFAMLEAGMARSKNTLNVLMKNYMDLCIGTLVFWLVGYGLMFGANPSGWFGTDHFFPNDLEGMTWGFVLFQVMFAATATTIASGAMAERTRFIGYLIGAVVICAVIYPVFGSWVWNSDGWLAKLGFIDFAGSTVVHAVGAWCALAGIIVVGSRLGRFDGNGKPREIRGHSLPLVALGGFFLWFGWFGFNGGSTLEASVDIGLINLNTQLSACAGAVAVLLTSLLRGKAILLTDTINGCLAGLVGITAGAATMGPSYALLTGFIAGLVFLIGQSFLLKLRFDDVVGAVAVHGFAGAWGTLAAGIFYAEAPFELARIGVQALGVVSCFAWAFLVALVMYLIIELCFGLRVSPLEEQRGLDLSEHAELAYPEFHADTAYRAERVNDVQVR